MKRNPSKGEEIIVGIVMKWVSTNTNLRKLTWETNNRPDRQLPCIPIIRKVPNRSGVCPLPCNDHGAPIVRRQ